MMSRPSGQRGLAPLGYDTPLALADRAPGLLPVLGQGAQHFVLTRRRPNSLERLRGHDLRRLVVLSEGQDHRRLVDRLRLGEPGQQGGSGQGVPHGGLVGLGTVTPYADVPRRGGPGGPERAGVRGHPGRRGDQPSVRPHSCLARPRQSQRQAGRSLRAMWDIDAVTQAIVAIATPLVAIIGVGSRKRRLRNDIKENLALVESVQKNDVLREHTPALGWLQGRIAVDIARLSGQPLGTPKRPIPRGSLIVAVIFAVGFGAWTYLIVQDNFVWYAVFPGVASAVMVISILGMFSNRDMPPDEELPVGATPIRQGDAQEQVATAVALAASGGADGRFDSGGQVDVVDRFVRSAQNGNYAEAVQLADENWVRCRVQAWLWNNRSAFGR